MEFENSFTKDSYDDWDDLDDEDEDDVPSWEYDDGL